MKTLITGATGFIGRHLVAALQTSSPSERLFTLGRTAPNLPGVTHVSHDLREAHGLGALVEKIAPDRLYHLAGGARVSGEISLPEYFESNFLTTARLFEALDSLSSLPAVFVSSSVHVYGNAEGSVSEQTPLHPSSPYGFTKYLAEEAARRFAAARPEARVVVARLYTCIGPGQAEGFVVSDLCRRLASLPDKPGACLKTGPLGAHRRFIDVRDAARLFPRLLAGAAPGLKVLNVASPHELRIDQLVDTLVRVSGKKVRVESSETTASNPFVGLDISVKELCATIPELGFRPIEETLRDTYAWAVSHP